MADDKYGTDLKLSRRSFDMQVSDRDYVDLTLTPGGDLRTISGRENLAQAIVNRLLTRKGELSRLGHPNYGSRLYQLVGEVNNLRTQGRAELYIREALSRESRIEEITFVRFENPGRLDNRSVMRVSVGLKPKGSEEDISLIIPINL